MHIFWLRNYNITKYSLITLYSVLFSGNTLHDVQKHLKYIKVNLLHFSYLQILVFNPCHDEYLYLLLFFRIFSPCYPFSSYDSLKCDIKTQMKLHIMICDISSKSTLSVKKCDIQRKLYNFQLEIFTSGSNMNSLDYLYLKC